MRPKGLHASRRPVLPCPPDKQPKVLHRNGRKRLARASLRCGCRHPTFWCGGQLGSQLPPLRLKQGLPIAPPQSEPQSDGGEPSGGPPSGERGKRPFPPMR